MNSKIIDSISKSKHRFVKTFSQKKVIRLVLNFLKKKIKLTLQIVIFSKVGTKVLQQKGKPTSKIKTFEQK